MYLSVRDFDKLQHALHIAFTPEVYNTLSEERKHAIVSADMVLMRLFKERKKFNQEQKRIIQAKRKTNKDYAGSHTEIEKRNAAIAKRAAKQATTKIQLNNTCYHCNYFRLLDETGKGHCLHTETWSGMIYSNDKACGWFEQEIVENVCTKHCEDCANYYNVNGCANYQICKHPDNRMYLIEGTYEACVKFQPKSN